MHPLELEQDGTSYPRGSGKPVAVSLRLGRTLAAPAAQPVSPRPGLGTKLGVATSIDAAFSSVRSAWVKKRTVSSASLLYHSLSHESFRLVFWNGCARKENQRYGPSCSKMWGPQSPLPKLRDPYMPINASRLPHPLNSEPSHFFSSFQYHSNLLYYPPDRSRQPWWMSGSFSWGSSRRYVSPKSKRDTVSFSFILYHSSTLESYILSQSIHAQY